MQTRGRGSKNTKILQTSYVHGPQSEREGWDGWMVGNVRIAEDDGKEWPRGLGAYSSFHALENSCSVVYLWPTQAATHSLTGHILTLFIVRELV